MVQSDTLSCLHHLNLEDNDNDTIVLLPDSLFIATIDTTLADRIKSVQSRDQVILDALKAVKDGTTLPMKSSLADWSFEDGLVFFRGRCYVPPDQDLRREVVRRYHNLRPMGHPGQFGTLHQETLISPRGDRSPGPPDGQ